VLVSIPATVLLMRQESLSREGVPA
jgi:hypothetical protein